jgi:hypothetical protein
MLSFSLHGFSPDDRDDNNNDDGNVVRIISKIIQRETKIECTDKEENSLKEE